MSVSRSNTLYVGSAAVLALIGSRILFPTFWKRVNINFQYAIFRTVVTARKLLTGKNSRSRPSAESDVFYMVAKLQNGLEGSTRKTYPPASEFRKRMEASLNATFIPPFNAKIKTRILQAELEDFVTIPVLHIESTRAPAKRTIHILYFHGGGFIEGSIKAYQNPISIIFDKLNALAKNRNDDIQFSLWLPEYRLSPEHKLPVPIDDCYQTYLWLQKTQKISPADIFFMGDSAGGNLTFNVALRVVAESESQHSPQVPRGLVAISPWLDLYLKGKSYELFDPICTTDFVSHCSDISVNNPDKKQLYSPICAPPELLGGLPPSIIVTGTAEIFLDDATTMAERLKDAGAQVNLKLVEGQLHVFALLYDFLPEAQEALVDYYDFIKNC